MRYSKLFGKTEKENPADSKIASHQLLYRAGFIRESTAGRYFILPLGQKVQQKIMGVIKEEMDKVGGQEMVAPLLHPLSLWEETNRTKTTGFELMKIKDRRGGEFALGGTAEEMFVDIVRRFQMSYKDLPCNLYQFSSKFRDELRARGGLLRVREFIMKDAYSFDRDESEFKKVYQQMSAVYSKIFAKLGLKTYIVESDNGYIGGEYCHEFVVESSIGESTFFVTEDGSYAAHQDIAKFKKEEKNINEELKDLQEVDAVRGTTMEDGVKLHKLPVWQQIKDVLFVDEKGRFVLAITRGDFDVNEIKLKHLAGALTLRHVTEEEIVEKTHSSPGFISPVGIKDNLASGVNLIVIADDSLRTIKNAYGGANKKHRDLLNVNIDRDYKPDIIGDIVLIKEGHTTESGKKLIEKRGVEVGNIFQLGYYYSSKMKGAVFIDEDGKEKPYNMGCYGIGIGRTMAAIVEIHHDKYGIKWPKNATPYQVYLINLIKNNNQQTDSYYEMLQKEGIDVLYDDRLDVSAGEKFATADLIGIPIRLVVSEKTGDKIELKERGKEEKELLDSDELLKKVKEYYL